MGAVLSHLTSPNSQATEQPQVKDPHGWELGAMGTSGSPNLREGVLSRSFKVGAWGDHTTDPTSGLSIRLFGLEGLSQAPHLRGLLTQDPDPGPG